MTLGTTTKVDLARARILVVDDEPSNRRLLAKLLYRAGYPSVDTATTAEAALHMYRELRHDVVLLDLHMPAASGFDVLAAFRDVLGPDGILPVIVVTGDDTPTARHRAHELGAADFVLKPFTGSDLVLRVTRLFEFVQWQRHMCTEADHVARAEEEILARLEATTRLHDEGTQGHTVRVAEMSARLGRRLGMTEAAVTRLRRAAPLHDVGKVAVGDQLLRKQGPLTEPEMAIMRRHTEVGAAILAGSDFPVLQTAEIVALTHHERWDGQGYPRGLAGEAIPLEGRIVAVADVFDALTHARPYKEAWTGEEALRELVAQRGRQFDPAVVDALVAELAHAHAEAEDVANAVVHGSGGQVESVREDMWSLRRVQQRRPRPLAEDAPEGHAQMDPAVARWQDAQAGLVGDGLRRASVA